MKKHECNGHCFCCETPRWSCILYFILSPSDFWRLLSVKSPVLSRILATVIIAAIVIAVLASSVITDTLYQML